MTDQTPENPEMHELDQGKDAFVARSASMRLRQQQAASNDAALMDPANESLADALRITFRILQAAMVVLGVLYVLSGFQSIKTNERGIRLIFGRVAATDLRPGFQFAPPYPIGELVKIDVGDNSLDINRAFWPYVKPGDSDKAEDLPSRSSLDPENDGSILTGDGSIAHTQWSVHYTRADSTTWARNVYAPEETAIIKAAVMRGIVQAVAEVRIDDLLKQGSTDDSSVAGRAKVIAQKMLSSVGGGTGIEIEQLSMESKIPPAYLRDAFSSVLSATSQASEARENAQKEGNTLLSQTAGGAASLLISFIDQYEQQIDAGQTEQAAKTLAIIDDIFDGKPVEVDGKMINPLVGGDVATRLSKARQYRSAVVDRAGADLSLFQAKLKQFQSNPVVMVNADWTSAMSKFLGDPAVQVFFNPPGTDTLEMVLNKDPEIAKKRESELRRKKNEEAVKKRKEMMEKDRYNTEEGLTAMPGG